MKNGCHQRESHVIIFNFFVAKNCLKTDGAPLKTRGKCLKLFAAFFITLFFKGIMTF